MESISTSLEEPFIPRLHRRGFIALGLLLTVLGALAATNLLAASLASLLIVGMLMAIGGFLQVVQAVAAPRWSSALPWLLSGVLYCLASLSVIVDPLFAMRLLTLLVAAALAVAGGFRLWIAASDRDLRGSFWLALSGLISLAAGIAIAIGWPGNSNRVLGLFLAFDLLFQGLAVLLLAFSIAPGGGAMVVSMLDEGGAH